MASIYGLRQLDERPPDNGGRSSHAGDRKPLVASLILLVTAVAASLATIATVGGAKPGAGPAPFVSRALGPHDPTFLLDRRWDDLTRVSIAGGGVAVRHDGTDFKLTAAGTGSASWDRHAWGVERPTAFGREAIVVAAPRTEEYLTVERRLGPRTWRWRLESQKSVPRLEADGSLSLLAAGVRAGVRVLPPVVYDAHGNDVTPAGTHWTLERRDSARFLALRVDDSSLPVPYVIDPITIVGSPGGTGSTKTGSPLSVTKPAGVATGNLLVATVSLRDATATLTPPAGWTPLTSIATSGNTTIQYVYTKVATGAEGASYSFSWTGGSGASDSSGVIIAYSGIWAGAGSNIDTSTTATANATTTAVSAAGTASYTQDMILALYGTAGDTSFTTPTGMTVRGTVTSQSGAPAVRSSSGTFDLIQAASGAVGAKSSTITNRDMTAVMVAIRPAAATASAANSTVTPSPASIFADGTTTSTVTATIEDTNGNPLPGKTVTLAKSGGSSTITTVSGTTDALGQATFTVKDSVVESTTYTATDTTDSMTVTQTAAVNFTVGPVTAAQSTVSASPTSVTANGVTTSTVTVTLKDAQSHPVSGKTVTLAKGSGSSTITTVSGTTNASGVATFTVKDTVAEATTYTATDTTDSVVVTQTPTVTFTVGPVTAAQSTVSASPNSIVADGSTTSTVTVTLKDAQSNPVSGKTVTLAKGSGSSTITTVSGTTNASGQATFTVKDTAVEATVYTATDTTDTITVTQTATVTFTVGPVTAAQSTVSASPASVTANGVAASTVTVTLKDAQSHPVSGKTVTLAKSGGSSTITTVSGTTNGSGVATFTVTDTVAEASTYTATDTTDSVTVTQTAAVTFTAGPVTAAQSTASASPTSVVADNSTTSTITVTLKDAQSNPVSGKTVTLAKSGGSSTITTVSGTTNASGQATFTVKDSAVEATTYTATDTTDAVTVTQTATVTFSVGPVTAAQSTASASPASVVADGSTTSTVTVTLKDAQSHPVAGKTVTLAKSGGSSTITTLSGTTNGSGVATFTVKDTVAEATTYTATDTTDSVTVTQTAAVTFTAGTPTAAQSTVSASPASVAADNSTTSTVTVTLRDANSNVVSGKSVSLAKSGGSSTITTVSGTTNGSGLATFTVKDATVESTTYTATDTTDSVTITQTAAVSFTAGALDATSSTVSAAPASVTANGSSSSTITVTAKDAFGHLLAGQSVSLAQGAGSSTITIVSATTNASGVATFTATNTLAQAVTYSATIGVTAILQTASVTYTPGPATHFTVTAPGSSSAGTPFSVTLTALDANNNTATAYTGTVAVTSNDGQAVLPTNYTFTGADNGSHTLSNAVTLKTAGSKTVVATDTVTGSTTGSTSVTVNPTAANATTSTLTASPTSILADGTTTSTLTATIRDPYNNPLAAKTVTLAKSAGNSTITTISGTTNASGQATFTATDTTAETTTYTATDTTDTLTITQTATVTFTSGAVSAAQSTVSASPGSVTADGSTTSTITVEAKDTFGNPVGGESVSLAQGGGNSTITTVSGTTDGSGVATFTVKDSIAELVTYTATIGATGVLQSASVDFTDGVPAAAQSTVGAAPSSVTADGTSTSTITVTLRDSHSTGVAGKTVTLAKSGGSSTIATISGVTNASGVATFTVTDTVAESTTYTATDTTDTIVVTQTATVTFDPGVPGAATSTVTAAPASVTADGSSSSTVTVTLRDANNNAVPGKTVTLAKSGGSSTITTISGITNPAGVATFTVTDTAAETTTYTATDTTDSVTVTQTAAVTFTPGGVTAAQSSASASPATVAADGSSFSTVTVTLRDVNGNAVAGKTVALAPGSGSSVVSPLSPTTDAAGEATFAVSDATAETVAYTATDSTDGVTVTQTASVTFAAGLVSSGQSTLAAAPASVTADGSSASTVTATLRDSNGNPVAGKTVTLTKGGGSSVVATVSGITDASGVATFTVTDTIAETTVYTAHDTTDTVTVAQTASVQFVAGAVTAAQSSVSASPGSVTADGSASSTVTTALRDAQSNPVAGKTVTLAKSGGSSTITTVSGVTDVSGVATFSVKDTVAETTTYTATDTSDGVTITQTAAVSFTAGVVSATQSTLTAAPATVTADGSTTSTLSVSAKDTFGNPVAAQPVFLAQGSGSSTITTVSGLTNASGVATFTAKSTLAATVTYTATIGVTGVLQTAAVTFTPGAVTHLDVAAPATVTAGNAGSATVTALDAQGNVVTGYNGTVSFSSTDPLALLPAAYTFTGADNGSHIFAATLKRAGARTITADDGTANGTTGTVTVDPAAADASSSTVTAAPGSVTADGSTTSTLTATIIDAYGNPIAGKTVTLSKSGGASTITTLSGTTDAAGDATFSVKNSVAETTTYTATDTTDSLVVTQTAAVTYTPGPVTAGQSTVSASPATLIADGSSAAAVTVTLRDANGNGVPGKTVTLTTGGGSPAIAPASAVSNASGVAVFSVTDAVAETAVLAAYDITDSVAVTQTASVTFTAGSTSAAQSTLSAAPGAVSADGVTTSMLTATLRDGQGNPVAGKTVTLAKSGGTSSILTLNGVTDASGAARFTVTDTTAETTTYTATDTTDSLTVAQTADVTFTAGAVSAVQSTVAAAPGSVTADGTSAATVTVTARDAFGNAVPAQVVALGQGAGSSTITPVSGTTNAFGVATFTVTGTTAETVTYTVSVGATAILQTAQVAFTPGPATQLVFAQQPTDTLSGATIAPAVAVRLLDAHNNLTSSTAQVSLAIKAGTGAAGATLGGTTTRNAVGGVATFTDISIVKAATAYRLTAQSSGVPAVDSASFDETVGALAAGHTTISASPATIDADGASGSTITVRARDANDNDLAAGGASVTLSSTLGTLGAVGDNGDGSYSATLTAGFTSGAAQVTGTINASTIGGPATVTIQPQQTTVVVDTGAPPAQTQSTGLTVTFHSDDASATFECSLDGAPFAACTSPTSHSGLADGAHTLKIHAVNGNGSNPDTTIAWTIDTQAPSVSFTTVPGPYTRNTSELLVASASDATTTIGSVTFRYGANAAACSTGALIFADTGAPYSTTWTTPADGLYVVCAIATDAVGQTAQANASVTVDQTAPAGTFAAVGTPVGPDRYVRGSVALHATATDATSLVDTVEFVAGALSIATVSAAPYDAAWSTTGDGPTTLGTVITDRAGNTTTLSQPVIRDNAAPAATLDDPGQWGHGTIPLSVSASDLGSGVDTAGIVIERSSDGGSSWSPIGSPATWSPADGTYELRAVVPDKVGNSATTGVRTIVIDNTPPELGDDADANWHNTSVTVALSAVDAESGVALPGRIEYKIDGGGFTTGASVVIPAPANGSNDGTHTLTYRATNRAGVTSSDKTTTVKIDATAPNNVTLDAPASAALLRGSVALAATAQDATAGVASTTFRLVAGALGAGSCATSGSAVTSPFDTTTVADGHYDTWVAAIDAAGNGRCSVTPHDVVIDNTRPLTTDNAPSGAQNHDVTVTLAATDNLSGVGLTEYSLDGGSNWTTGTSVTVLAANGDGTTTIAYRSRDLAGNVEIAKSTSVTIDTTAPAGGVNDPGSVLRGTVSLTASPSDPDVASVQFLYRPAGPGAYTPIATDTTAPYDVPWITTGPATPDGLYDLEIIVTDTAGNATTVALSAKTIDNAAPDSATVTAPAAGANAGGSSIALAANATDATSGVASVAFQVKPTGASSFTTVDADTNGAPFTGLWSPAPGTPDGPVDVRIAVTDLAGNGPTFSAAVTFTLDRTDPAVSLSAPTPVAASAALTATGSADIDHVVYAYSADGGSTWTSISTGNSPSPYGVTWTTPLVDGSYQVRATAVDGGGNEGTDVKTIQVDRTDPSGALTQPAAAATVGGASVPVAASASDPGGSGVASVTFRYGPTGGGAFTTLATDGTAPFSATWDVTGLASGSYDLQAAIVDTAGNTTLDLRTVTVDSTPPSPTAIVVGSSIRANAPIGVATSGDTVSATYSFDVAGGAVSWTQVGTSTTSPTFATTVDTTALADGVYDVRAIVVDQFGNSATIVQSNVRVDNTPPSVFSSTPADGSVTSSASSLGLTASEDIASITQLKLDGVAAAFASSLAGPTASFPTGLLADGNHRLTGWLHDATGNTSPFRLNVTIDDGAGVEQPETTKNVSSTLPTILASVDGATTVTTPANVWQAAPPQAQDFLVLRIDPTPAPTSIPPTTIQLGSPIVDVRMTWDLAGTDEHHFDAPVQIDLNDSTSGLGTPVTAEPGGAWRAIPSLAAAGTLPGTWQDGYWRTGNVVHILTRHLSLFAILTGVVSDANAAPKDFAAVLAADGLTLRWLPGIPQVRNFVLYADGKPIAQFGGEQFETKLGQIAPTDTRRFTLTEINPLGIESSHTAVLRAVPPLAGLSQASAAQALAERGFVVGRIVHVSAPGIPAGTVVGPTGVRVQEEGTEVDLQVASPSARSPFALQIAIAPRAQASNRSVASRVSITDRARIDVTLDAKPFRRVQRWHFLHVKPGATVLTLKLRSTLPVGTYDLHWKATSDSTKVVLRKVTTIRVVAKSGSRSQNVVSVSGGRTTQGVTKGLRQVSRLTPEQAFLYATDHAVRVIVVDADVYGPALARDLHQVFPSSTVVAVSKLTGRRAALQSSGVVAVPVSQAAATVARLLRG